MMTAILTGLLGAAAVVWAIVACLLMLATHDERPKHWPFGALAWPLIFGALAVRTLLGPLGCDGRHETVPGMRCTLPHGHSGQCMCPTDVMQRNFDRWWRRWSRISSACGYAALASLAGAATAAVLAPERLGLFAAGWGLFSAFLFAARWSHRRAMTGSQAYLDECGRQIRQQVQQLLETSERL